MSHATIQTYGGTGTQNRMTTVFNPLRDVRAHPRSYSPYNVANHLEFIKKLFQDAFCMLNAAPPSVTQSTTYINAPG